MKFFIDTANIDEISQAMKLGVLSGVTTNPSLYAKTGGKLADFDAHMQKICDICKGLPVSAETTKTTAQDMIEDARRLHALADNIVVKIPVCEAGLEATHALAQEGIPVNMTLVFSATQALLAARAGARYISPFIGRFDDINEDGLAQLEQIVACLQNYDFGHEVEIIAASIRNPHHVTQAALMGCDIATVPYTALQKCLKHPLTDQGLAKFEADWQSVVEK